MAAVPTPNDDILRFCISRALKTTVRNVLLLVYKYRFSLENHHKGPYEALIRNEASRNILNNDQNVELRDNIKENREEKFDITTLYLLLKYACGLSRRGRDWRNLNRLEGNIQKLRDLRNEDAHWTEDGCPEQDLEDTWKQMCDAVTNVLKKADLTKGLEKVKRELEDIRKPPQLSELSLQDLQRALLQDEDGSHAICESIQSELRELYKGRRKTTLMPILWGGLNFSFHHHVNKTYTKTRLTTICDGIEEEVDGEDIFRNADTSRTIILQGESGTGKTSLLRHYATAWRPNLSSVIPALTYIDYLFFLDCTAVGTRTFTVSDIFQEILPKSKGKWQYHTIIRELVKAESAVMFMIDAFDERLQAFRDAFKQLQKALPQAFFIVTTRPHCTQAIMKMCLEKAVVVTAQGFNRSSAEEYVNKLFKTHGKNVDPQLFFKALSKYEELVTIPQLLCWSSWFWLENGKDRLPTRGMYYAHITDFMLRKMCHIHDMRIIATELPQRGKQWLYSVSRLAFSQAKHDDRSYNESSLQIKKLYEEAKQLDLRPQEALSSLMQCDSSQKAEGEYIVFQFLHDSHANFLIAHYIFETLLRDKKVTLKKLFRGIKEERQKSVMSFFVSLLSQASSVIQPEVLEELIQISKHFVRYFDINHYLELIEESGYNFQLVHCMSRNIPREVILKKNTVAHFDDQLWLRPKELLHIRALILLLSQAKPERLWLRLCEGPHADEDNPVRGYRVEEGNPVLAMRVVSQAYGEDALQELRLTDVTLSSPLSWPKYLIRLCLERCHITANFILPPELYKLTVIDCTGLKNVNIHSNISSLVVRGCHEGLKLPLTLRDWQSPVIPLIPSPPPKIRNTAAVA